ncbi:serine protease [Nostoc sp. XA010]|uniref:S1 family peptidase n=1 Tax=Nostoc sp. XA010 TaxID=2780407 RepID=UPI001E48A158|nr:serine protease [Nostoc sp. XA010]MCC5659048.1 serine protease [Nostoc sp. XA010]
MQSCLSTSVSQSTYKIEQGVKKSFTNNKTISLRESNSPVAEIAKKVTIRILTEPGSGSGVLIAHQGETYTVLTCQHVVANSKGSKYSVLSADGKIYPARLKAIRKLKDIDLALVQFDSKTIYPVVKLGNSNLLTAGFQVYAAGFPNYHSINKDAIEDTRNWGTKAYRFTTGKISMMLVDKSLPQGYRLGYTNEVEVGMSGGPVLNEKGELVGINGRLKYPIQGIDVFTFADGSKPSVEMFQQMEALSWGIPIAMFRQLAEDSLTH